MLHQLLRIALVSEASVKLIFSARATLILRSRLQ